MSLNLKLQYLVMGKHTHTYSTFDNFLMQQIYVMNYCYMLTIVFYLHTEWFISLLKTTHCKEFKSVNVVAKIYLAFLSYSNSGGVKNVARPRGLKAELPGQHGVTQGNKGF